MPVSVSTFSISNLNLIAAWAMWCLGMCLVCGLYFLIGLHFQTYLTVISPLLKKRFGTELGLIWIVVGLVLVYNIVYNHFLAMMIKPGSPSDLRKVEKMRQE